MISFEFILPKQLILTSNGREHWAIKARRTAALRTKAAALWAKTGETMPRAHCDVHITFRDRRRRDALNWAPTVKALVDGLVSGPPRWPDWVGLLPDDDSGHLTGPHLSITEPDTALSGVRFLFQFRELP